MIHLRININRIVPVLCGLLSVLIMSAIFYSVTDFELYSIIERYVGISSFIVTTPIFLLYSRWKSNDFLKIIIFAVGGLFIVIINPYSTLGSYLSLLTSLMMMQNLNKIEISKRIATVQFLIIIAFLLYSFRYSFVYRSNWWVLSHTYIGANAWGRYVCFSAILLVVLSEHYLFDKKIINTVFLIIATIIILFFRSRGALLCLTFFLIMYLISYIPRDTKKVKLFFAVPLAICLVVPIVAVIISPMLSIGEMFEKSLFSGRDEIWKSIFLELAKNPLGILFGLGANKLEAGSYSGFVHNNMYGIIVNYGLFGLTIYLSMLYSIIKEKSKSIIKNKSNWHAYLAVVSIVFVLGTTEITSLWVTEAWFCYIGLGLIDSDNNYNLIEKL